MDPHPASPSFDPRRGSPSHPFHYLTQSLDLHVHRRNLPHWHQDGALAFVTFRLLDSLPAERLLELRAEREAWVAMHPTPWSPAEAEEYRRRFAGGVDRLLDDGSGCCLFPDPRARGSMEEVLLHGHGRRYHLDDGVVAANHVHVLVAPWAGMSIGRLVGEWKSVSARRLRALGEPANLWQPEYHDHLVRNAAAHAAIRDYIRRHPGWRQWVGGGPGEGAGPHP